MIIGIQAVLLKLKAFTDSFTRSNDANTLKAAGTKNWQNTRGTWGISSNKASTATAAATYPLASIKTGSTYATAKIGYGTANQFGWGLAFWVADQNNWYASVTDKDSYSTSYSYTAYACNSCGGGVTCSGYPDCGCAGAGCLCSYYSPCSGTGSCGDGPACNGQGAGGSCNNPCGGGCYFVNNGNGTQCEGNNGYNVGGYAYTVSGSTTNYRYWLRTIKSLSGSVTTVNSQQILDTTTDGRYFDYVQVATSTPSSEYVRIQTVLNGSASVFHDVNLSVAAKAKAFGIVLWPATTGTQATTVDDFVYTPTA